MLKRSGLAWLEWKDGRLGKMKGDSAKLIPAEVYVRAGREKREDGEGR